MDFFTTKARRQEEYRARVEKTAQSMFVILHEYRTGAYAGPLVENIGSITLRQPTESFIKDVREATALRLGEAVLLNWELQSQIVYPSPRQRDIIIQLEALWLVDASVLS